MTRRRGWVAALALLGAVETGFAQAGPIEAASVEAAPGGAAPEADPGVSVGTTPLQTPAAEARSDVPPQGDGTVYERAYFDQFAPQNADDMLERVPGFVIRGGEGGARGFGQASLNVLINGRRPSTKSVDIDDILSRISPERVVRIEVVDGATLDIPGLTGDVANIVTQNFGLTGNWEYAARFEEGTEPQLLDAEASVTVSRGDATLTLSANSGQFTFTEDGDEQFFLADGSLIEDRFEDRVFENQRPELDATFNWTPPSGDVLNLSANISKQNRNFDERQFSEAVGPGGITGQNVRFDGEDEIEFELGGDYEFGVGPDNWGGRLKMIGLYRYEDSAFISRVGDFRQGLAPTFAEFLQDVVEREAIARSELTWDEGAWQLSGEYAFNGLEADSEFNGDAFPGVEVEEDRIQGALAHNRKLGDWDLAASLGAEYSEIRVPSNPAAEARSFVRPRGFLTAARDIGAKLRLDLRAERQVGQLNFFDFVSDLDLDEGRDDAGNERIVPTQSWFLQAAVERSDPKGLSWRLAPELSIIEDPIDVIVLPGGGEGPGNLDSTAYSYGVRGNFTLVLDEQVKGLRLSGNGLYIDSDIEDPLTAERRIFNNFAAWFYSLQLRHDIANTPFAYEINFQETDNDIRLFRRDQVLQFSPLSPRLGVTVEHKDVLGMNLRLRLDNVIEGQERRARTLFLDDRLGPVSRTETRLRKRGMRLSVVLSDTF